MYILGLNAGRFMPDYEIGATLCSDSVEGHDASAVLMKDDKIIAAIEEERISRIKHTTFFPRNAAQFCLDQAGIRWNDVDQIAIDRSEIVAMNTMAYRAWSNAKASLFSSGREFIASIFMGVLGVNIFDRIFFCDHHEAHLWSTWGPCGFNEALVVSMDGMGAGGDKGELESICVASANRKDGLKIEQRLPVNQSLGNLYFVMLGALGYGRHDEYKVMGLAPYGDVKRFEEDFKNIYTLKENGDFELHGENIRELIQKIELYPFRRKGEAFTQRHMDYAAGLQNMLETIALHFLTYLGQSSGQRNLALAGGVALNCSMNGKLLETGIFDQIFVQPASHDAGLALGTALKASHDAGYTFKGPMKTVYWGTDIGRDKDIQDALEAWSDFIEFGRQEDIAAITAQLLADDHVIGWVQERSEFGPRALGNRSILADPRPEKNKERINKMVKKREGYRPFAPSVLVEYLRDFFQVSGTQEEFPFMNFVFQVHNNWLGKLGAITHIDGSARVQTVNKKDSPRYWKLIKEFYNLTDIPILLNTSFNNDVEPIVDTVDDSVVCFLTTAINYLVVGDYLVKRRHLNDDQVRDVLLKRSLKLVNGRFLVKVGNSQVGYRYLIKDTEHSDFIKREIEISSYLFKILCFDTNTSFGNSIKDIGIFDQQQVTTLVNEARHLWDRRAIKLGNA